jgi:hypothetical protein
MVSIARYQTASIIQMHTSPFVVPVGRSMTRKVRLMLKNNSYVCIPADKLAAIIDGSCPPISWLDSCRQLDREVWDEIVCINCWKSWLKDGE